MRSQIESSKWAQYTPLYENNKFEHENKSMETTILISVFSYLKKYNPDIVLFIHA